MGYSNCGKSTVEKELIKQGFNKFTSHTTRDKRKNEVDGVDYFYITKDKFHSMSENGDFVESRHYFTFKNVDGKKQRDIFYYALSKQQIKDDSKPSVIVVDKDGAIEISKYVGEDNVVLVYLECSEEVLEARSVARGDFKDEYIRRLQADKKSFKGADKIAHGVVSGEMELERVVESVVDIYNYYNGL